MTVWVGNYTAYSFVLKSKTNCEALDITGWEFQADIKANKDDETALLSLDTDGGGFAVITAAEGRFEMRITALQSEDLPTGKLFFDIRRTDVSPGPIWLFGGSFFVKTPVTLTPVP
jgi:hypothetical protein